MALQAAEFSQSNDKAAYDKAQVSINGLRIVCKFAGKSSDSLQKTCQRR